MAKIFISYRRDDSKWITGRIFDRLEEYYGSGQVFIDIDNIPIGRDFRAHIHQILEGCDIVLAVIGPQWLQPDAFGRPRINSETDWVRLEIAAALSKSIPVVPLLIDDAQMPEASALPPDIRDFAFRHAAVLDSGIDFRAHVRRLTTSLDRLLAQPPPNAASTRSAPAEVQTSEALKTEQVSIGKRGATGIEELSDNARAKAIKGYYRIFGFGLISILPTVLLFVGFSNLKEQPRTIIAVLLATLIGLIALFIGFEPLARSRRI